MYRYPFDQDFYNYDSLENGQLDGASFFNFQSPFVNFSESTSLGTDVFEIILPAAHIDEADLPSMGGCGCCDCGQKNIADMLTDFDSKGSTTAAPVGPSFMDSVPGDSTTTASIAIGASIDGTRETTGDNDWYQVTLEAGTSYTFFMVRSGENPHADPRLRLIDTDGTTELVNNDDADSDGDGTGDNQNSAITFTASADGVY